MSQPPLRVLRYGEDAPLPTPVPLRAGPLSAILENGDLRYVRLGDREVLRRVYVAVRDRSWGTVLPRLSNLRLEQRSDSFRVVYDCRHSLGEIDYLWRGVIVGDPDGTITFRMEGEARSTFMANRVGICVLHPIKECAGAPYSLLKVDGSTETGTLPRYISPHQPVKDVRTFAHEVLPGLWAEVQLEGEVFEMEDQRNWTDASFKTYSTPLDLPHPIEVRRGTRSVQAVKLTIRGDAPAPSGDSVDSRLTLSVGESAVGPLPRIGLGDASHRAPLSERQIERLRALRLSHLRADLDLSRPDYPDVLRRTTDIARSLGAKLEVALNLADDADVELARLRALLDDVRPEVCWWLVFHAKERATSGRWVDLARQHLAAYDAAARFGSGASGDFVELNRERPALDSLDLVCYSLNPQVHAFDNLSLVETLEGQAETVRSARQFCGTLPLAVTPVTLRPRSGSGGASALAATAQDLPQFVDARQMSLFGAAWTAGSLKALAEAGVESATYYETTGWRGVMETEAGSPLPQRFRSVPGAVFPLYHVLADVGELAGAEVVGCESSDPVRVTGLALRRHGALRVVVASLSGEPSEVVVRGLPGQVRLRTLDETNALEAMTSPEEFRGGAGELADAPNGELSIELLPYAVARIDAAL